MIYTTCTNKCQTQFAEMLLLNKFNIRTGQIPPRRLKECVVCDGRPVLCWCLELSVDRIHCFVRTLSNKDCEERLNYSSYSRRCLRPTQQIIRICVWKKIEYFLVFVFVFFISFLSSNPYDFVLLSTRHIRLDSVFWWLSIVRKAH